MDERLTWNVSDFENIKAITVKTNMMWVPDIVLINKCVYNPWCACIHINIYIHVHVRLHSRFR